MKKLVQLFTSVLSLTALSTNVISCNSKTGQNYNTFLKYANDTSNSYIIMISGQDGSDTKKMVKDIWTPLMNNDDLSSLYSTKEYNFKDFISPTNPKSNGNVGITLGSSNAHFETLQGQIQSKLWDENWSKNVLKWCAQKWWNTINPDKDISGYSKYVSDFESSYASSYASSPMFVYLYHGQLMGIYNYSVLISSGNLTKNSGDTFLNWAYNSFINQQTKIWYNNSSNNS